MARLGAVDPHAGRRSVQVDDLDARSCRCRRAVPAARDTAGHSRPDRAYRCRCRRRNVLGEIIRRNVIEYVVAAPAVEHVGAAATVEMIGERAAVDGLGAAVADIGLQVEDLRVDVGRRAVIVGPGRDASPLARAVTVGYFWSSAVEVLTVNASPDLSPPAVKTWALMAEPSPSPAKSSHTTMKRPSVSAATAGVHRSDALVTTNSPQSWCRRQK